MSNLLLAILLFLMAASWLGWFAVSPFFMGVVALATAIVLVLEGYPVARDRYIVRK